MMKRIIYSQKYQVLILFCFFAYSCSVFKGVTKVEENVSTNGIYQSNKVDGYWCYLRFYKDSTVIAVSSTGKPKRLKNWFNKDNENISIGKYEIRGDSLLFNTEGANGNVLYSGLIKKKSLLLNSNSLINGFHDKKNYRLKDF